MGEGPAYHIASKSSVEDENKTPGPGTYENTSEKKFRSIQYSIISKPKPIPRSITPGPSSYKIATKNWAKGLTIPHADKFIEARMYETQ
jgi:hypothetical protein